MNKMTVVICEPNKMARVEEIGENLETYQDIVGGYIECFYPFEEEICIVCNDEGKFNGCLPNRGVYNGNELIDIIFGTFFIVGCGGEDFSSLTDDEIDLALKMFEKPEKFKRDSTGKIVGIKYIP